jgi:hypothetical protein
MFDSVFIIFLFPYTTYLISLLFYFVTYRCYPNYIAQDFLLTLVVSTLPILLHYYLPYPLFISLIAPYNPPSFHPPLLIIIHNIIY